ncbi:hypothetical protein [Mycolicibacterium sp. J2]|uniref:hypothetical protein n=1 Tax=Mycolicibacterium sp. J2 TaxID=2993511 RepID=UPI00224AB3E5|nr:hypothetical protein [Mycolicibacterium sp. J2]MCX2715202.1 hypothetical protein [Mycolicibacterium sp. J2]
MFFNFDPLAKRAPKETPAQAGVECLDHPDGNLGRACPVGHDSGRHEIASPGKSAPAASAALPQKPRTHAGFDVKLFAPVGELRKTYKTIQTKSHHI